MLSLLFLSLSDRIRTTNNMLGDCYAAAVLERLSRSELSAQDASNSAPDTPTAELIAHMTEGITIEEDLVVHERK